MPMNPHEKSLLRSALAVLAMGIWVSPAFCGDIPGLTGSGTAWLPPLADPHGNALAGSLGAWSLMAHGEALLRYTRQNANHTGRWEASSVGERGGQKIDGPAWFMLQALRPLPAGASLGLRTMLSLDPLTEGRPGYPLLFQSGEGLIDRQHAHDMFMELSATLLMPVGRRQAAFLYFGLPGEPALGPVAFMHRPAARENPDAPLSHHMQDASHITFGVATVGWILGNTKIDASVFRGQEPDTDRLDIEAPRFDSYSLRMSRHLRPDLSAQASWGFLNAVRMAGMPAGMRLRRLTASVDYSRPFSGGTRFSAALLYGMNDHAGMDHPGPSATHSLGSEAQYDRGKQSFWTRGEALQRMGYELDLPGRSFERYWVRAFTAGTSRSLFRSCGMELLAGAQGTVHSAPDLEEDYGDHPLAWQAFLRLRPWSPRWDGPGGHHHLSW